MPEIKKTNIWSYLKSKFSNTPSDIKMNGTRSVGNSDWIARADHVHPTDTSRAASNHAHGSISNDGKIGNTANKPLITGSAGAISAGDFEATQTNIKMNGAQSVGLLNTFARGDHVHPSDTTKQNEVETQSKIVGFINKDRIELSRIWDYINNTDANYYKLDLMESNGQGGSSAIYSHEKVQCIAGTSVMVGCTIYKGKTSPSAQDNITYNIKYLDGTLITSNTSQAREIPNSWSDINLPSTPGIYYIYAEATINGSVVRSQILSLFVKSNNNILPHELWTPDYLMKVPLGTFGNFRLSATSTGYTYTNESSSIGEASIRQEVENAQYIVLFYDNPNLNKDYTAKVDLYTNIPVILQFISRDTSNRVVKTVNVPANTKYLEHSVSIQSSEFAGSETSLQFRVVPQTDDGKVFIDNYQLITS